MRRRSTSWRWLLVTVLVLGVGGCGLSRYEDKMDEQRKRVAAFDGLNNSLDNPIDMPLWLTVDKKEVPAWPYEVFLRLPKGFGPAMKDKNVHSRTFPLARYHHEETRLNNFVVATYLQEPKKSDEPGKWIYTPEGFRTQLRVALAAFCSRTYQTDLPERSRATLSEEVETFSPYPNSGSTVRYESYRYVNVGTGRVTVPFTFEVYIHEEAGKPGKQIAIVFQRAAKMTETDSFNNSVRASLSTLDISDAAATKRSTFKRR